MSVIKEMKYLHLLLIVIVVVSIVTTPTLAQTFRFSDSSVEKGDIYMTHKELFADGKWVKRPENKVFLACLIDFLERNPNVLLEVGIHTDNQGSAENNDRLSFQKARSIASYIMLERANLKQITYRGYGESKPLISSSKIRKLRSEKEKELAHEKNNRLELKVVSTKFNK